MMAPRSAPLTKIVLLLFLVATVWSCANGRDAAKDHAVRKPVPRGVSGEGMETASAAGGPNGFTFSKMGASLLDAAALFRMAEKKPGYSPEGKVDPFQPLFTEESAPAPSPVPGPSGKPALLAVDPCDPTPLTRVGLAQLKLVAILRGGSGAYALVEDASGKGYVLKHRVCVGIHSGRVTDIKADGVVIQERFQDLEFVEGQWRPADILTRERKITFPREKGA